MTQKEAIEYAKSVKFCNGCPIDMAKSDGSECDNCEHRLFFEKAIDALEKIDAVKTENRRLTEVLTVIDAGLKLLDNGMEKMRKEWNNSGCSDNQRT